MVYLNRIYTKTGDDGTTALGDGTRVSKTHPRIVAFGAVDELNSVLGMAISAGLPDRITETLRLIQNDLFDLGADLCGPEAQEDDPEDLPSFPSTAAPKPPPVERLRVTDVQVERLENWIDSANELLQPLNSFILPGGSLAAAHLHLARTVCRRVEIGVLHLCEFDYVNEQVNVYLNRLSDLLFVLARLCNNCGRDDVLWVPGKNR